MSMTGDSVTSAASNYPTRELGDEGDEKQYWVDTMDELLAETEVLEGLVADAGFKWSEDFGPATREGAELLEAQAHLNSALDRISSVLQAAKKWQT